ncbi:hypothetical protein [Actinomyces minihominis]|uniref:hypothetical protein n=1 Tax=Actinomyces minihominis TaxID=2002838 RepID=UPI000C071C63|nr:hypothetical protein [Actinomyces minihominis]
MKVRQGLAAIAGIAVALGLITAMVFWLYSDVRTQSGWANFVEDSAPKVVAASELLEQGESVLAAAEHQKVDPAIVEQLQAELDGMNSLVEKAMSLADYVVTPVRAAAGVGEERPDEMLVLDPLEVLASGFHLTDVTTPEEPKDTYSNYRSVMNALAEQSLDLQETIELVESHIDSTLEAAHGDWSVAVELLVTKIRAAMDALQSGDPNLVSAEQWQALWDLAIRARTVLGAARSVDTQSVAELKAATEQVTAMIAELDAGFDPYFNPVAPPVEAPVVGGETEIYQEPDTWFPQGGNGETTPTYPEVPVEEETPGEPGVPTEPTDPDPDPIDPIPPVKPPQSGAADE